MSQYDSFDSIEVNRYQQNYFALDFQSEDNKKLQENTGLLRDCDDLPQKPQSFKENEIELAKSFQEQKSQLILNHYKGQVRPKKFIQVGQKSRSNYMKAKKGDSEETNDLSINVFTLMKSLCDGYKTFNRIKEGEQQLIASFKNSKKNINAIKTLMTNEKMDIRDEISEFICSYPEEKMSINEFFSQQLKNSSTLIEVLKSKKMKFCNKIRFIKYLEVIKKSFERPQEFEGWKKSRR